LFSRYAVQHEPDLCRIGEYYSALATFEAGSLLVELFMAPQFIGDVSHRPDRFACLDCVFPGAALDFHGAPGLTFDEVLGRPQEGAAVTICYRQALDLFHGIDELACGHHWRAERDYIVVTHHTPIGQSIKK
jgi:hypothetical protein